MLTIIVKRSDEPSVIHLTQENIMKELGTISGAEMLLTDTWREGLKQVRTPYVCLVEADCVLSGSYISSNYGLMKQFSPAAGGVGSSPEGGIGGKRIGSGGYTKVAMIASCLGVGKFDNRIYNYHLNQVWSEKSKLAGAQGMQTAAWKAVPRRDKPQSSLYSAQIGFVPGAIMRMSVIKDLIDKINWDYKNLVEMSTDVSFALWTSGRRLQVNPNTTYVSNVNYLEDIANITCEVGSAGTLFTREGIS